MDDVEHTIRMAIKYLIGSAHYTLFVAAVLVICFQVGRIAYTAWKAAKRRERAEQARHRR